MTSNPQYLHGSSDAREVQRLEQQARYIAPHSLARFVARAGEHVLDLGTGVGAMAQQLMDRFPGIQLVAVDLRESQLEHARMNHPGPRYVQANAAQLPFPDATFDRAHASWLLEHVPDPPAVVKEVHRVLKPGGTCQFLEVDNSTLRIAPEDAELRFLFDTLDRLQQTSGGDPFIGAKLGKVFEAAGFAKVTVTALALGGDRSQQRDLEEIAEEFARILESADEVVPPDLVPRLQGGAARLRALPARENAEIRYVATVLTATK